MSASDAPYSELEAREEVRKECFGRCDMKTKEAIYEVLEAYPKARLVRRPMNVYSIDTLGAEPGELAVASRADIAWRRAARAI